MSAAEREVTRVRDMRQQTAFGADAQPARTCPFWSTWADACNDPGSCHLPPVCINGMVATDLGSFGIMEEVAVALAAPTVEENDD